MKTALWTCLGLLPLAAVGCRGAEVPEPHRDRPNILLIVADDLGYSDLGCYGSEIPTPNLDALAESGMRGTDFYAAPRGAPSRAMLMTGVDNHVAGFGSSRRRLAHNQEGRPGYEGHLSSRVVTVASLLRAGGYHTVMAGKWELGGDPASLPAARGFEKSFALHDGAASHWSDMRSAIPGRDRATYTHDGEPVEALPEDYFSTRFFTDFVKESIAENTGDGRPFFAYLAFQAPHGPLAAPEAWRDRAKGRYDEGYGVIRKRRLLRMKMIGLVKEEVDPYPGIPTVPRWDELDEQIQRRQARKMELYAAMVENLDFHVGRLVDFLKERGEYDDTVIVFLSDNGAEAGDRGPNGMDPRDREWYAERFPLTDVEDWGRPGSFVEYGPAWAQVSTVPFRLFKGTMAEGGIRAPIVWHGPPLKPNGGVSRLVLHVTDLPATFLDLAGVAYPERFAGRVLAPLEGRSLLGLETRWFRAQPPHPWLGFEYSGDRALRRGRWKLVQMPPPFGSGAWRLYRLDRDPSELHDQAAEEPALREQLLGLWEEYARDHGVIVPAREPVEPAEPPPAP